MRAADGSRPAAYVTTGPVRVVVALPCRSYPPLQDMSTQTVVNFVGSIMAPVELMLSLSIPSIPVTLHPDSGVTAAPLSCTLKPWA